MAHSVTDNQRVNALNAAVNAFNSVEPNELQSQSGPTSLHPIMNAYLDVIDNDKNAENMLLDDTKPSIK